MIWRPPDGFRSKGWLDDLIRLRLAGVKRVKLIFAVIQATLPNQPGNQTTAIAQPYGPQISKNKPTSAPIEHRTPTDDHRRNRRHISLIFLASAINVRMQLNDPEPSRAGTATQNNLRHLDQLRCPTGSDSGERRLQ